MSEIRPALVPFLKWPGGKRWLADIIAERARVRLRCAGTYFEPFVGAAAVYFRLLPQRAVLSDINADLTNAFVQVRDKPSELIRLLRRFRVSAESYYAVRASRPRSPLRRAARFLFLNRTAFAGMYRLNKRGGFNVPYGGGQRTPEVLWKTDLLLRSAVALQSAAIDTVDFESQLDAARHGDVVYCDPTYTVAHENNGFVRYNEHNFSWLDQERLAAACRRAAARGAYVLISNAFHPSIAALYQDADAEVFERWTSVSRLVSGRRLVREYLFTFSASRARARGSSSTR